MKTGEDLQRSLYLASNSPRRMDLLALCGWEFTLLPTYVDEAPLPAEDGVEYVKRMARNKAQVAAESVEVGAIIIAADTTVIGKSQNGKNEIFGKPVDQKDAVRMLHVLRGQVHHVYTAISIFYTPDGIWLSDLCGTKVPMRDYDDNEVEAYVASGDPMDKAGAYAIQHTGFHPVEKLTGCFANVMGLPLCHLTRSLMKIGVKPLADVPDACQATLGYNCSVYPQIIYDKDL